jgi:hypothetical protein
MSNKTNKSTETVTSSLKKFVVVRSGARVSELLYESKQDAKIEFDHWSDIVHRWPDGTKIEIAEYDEKKHKV